MNDVPDEALKQPLVDSQESATKPRPEAQPQAQAGGNRGRRSPVESSAEEEKEEVMRGQATTRQQQQQQQQHGKQPLPYSAPNVHPYAVPQYQPQGYGGDSGGDGWGSSPDDGFEDSGNNGATVDIVFSGMYTLAAAFTIIQGFGMLIHFTYAAIALGFYTMAFGAAVILYDLKSVVNGVSVEAYFPFLGNYIGRAATVLFFAVLCGQTYEYAGWTKFIIIYNLLVATLQGFVYFTTKTVTASQQPHMDVLPDL